MFNGGIVNVPVQRWKKRMQDKDLQRVVDGELPPDVAASYLNLYLGPTDWNHVLADLFTKHLHGDGAMMRKMVCCAILAPVNNPHIEIRKPPESLLYGIRSFNFYNSQDWYKTFQDVVKKDIEINAWRKKAWSLGVIDPIEFSPNTRQAFNWLYTQAEETGDITPENKEEIIHRFRNLVYAYGGAVICGVFTRNKDALKKVVNWRSGYFFERLIFDVYSIEQVLKIKQMELDSASEKLVKRVKSKAE